MLFFERVTEHGNACNKIKLPNGMACREKNSERRDGMNSLIPSPLLRKDFFHTRHNMCFQTVKKES